MSKKHINLQGKDTPYMRVNLFSTGDKITSAMLQRWNTETKQWEDVRPLHVKEDGTVVYSELSEEQEA